MTSAFPAVRAEARPDLIAAGSPTQQLLADPLLYVYALPGFLLPLFHPATAAATMQRDRVFTDPDADLLQFALRLRDTIEMIAAVALGGEEADHVAYAMRELHRTVSGKDTRGAGYHAWTRDIWTWNWSAIVAALMTAYGNGRGYPDDQFRDDAYLGLVEVGRRFGVIGMPETYADFVATWPTERDRIADPTNDTLQRLLGFLDAEGLPRPRQLRGLPDPLWGPLSLPIRHLLRISIALGLDEDERRMLGVTSRATDALEIRVHRALWQVALPRPVAYRAGVWWIQAHQRWGNPVWRTRFSATALAAHRESA